MGATMGCNGMELPFSKPCYLVDKWCAPYVSKPESKDPYAWHDEIGVFDIPQDAVIKANAVIPVEYDPSSEATKEDWDYAREFLAHAAAHGGDLGIYGGY